MKREIKFRAWDKELATMDYYGSLKELATEIQPSWFDRDVELMQYSGLKDKNGKEIYEGDILRNLKFKNSIAVVEWTNDLVNTSKKPVQGLFGETKSLYGFFTKLGAFTLKHIKDNKAFHIQDTEIIGNIYENPELLTK